MRKQKQTTSHYLWRAFGFPALVITVIAVLSLVRAGPARAAPGTNQQLNYQARLLSSQGAVVPDGLYNIEFKIYQDGNGVLGGGDESLEWTETRSGANKVTVKNGYFSVYLGSVTPFGSSVDWNQDTLWLSVNIGGTGASPAFDGEMSPFTRLSSTPYAINSRQLGGLTSTQFVQLAQGAQTDSSADASVHINDTAGGHLLHLLSGGTDRFIVSNTGTVTAATALDTINGIVINNGAISGVDGFTQDTGNFDVSASNGTFQTSSGAVSLNGNTSVTGTGTLTVIGGLTTLDGGLVVSSGIDNNSGGITETGSLTGVGTQIVANDGLDISTGNGGSLSLNSGSNILVIDATDTTFSRVASGTYTFDFSDTSNTIMALQNSSTGSANLNLIDGALFTSGTVRLTNAGALQNITGLTVISGGANITGGLNNNSGGITNSGSIAGVSTLTASGNITTTGNISTTGSGTITSAGTFTAQTGLTISSGGALVTAGNLALTAGSVTTNGTTRLTNAGALQNITGLTVVSGGASITGDLNNNNGSIVNAGAISGVTTLLASGTIGSVTGFAVNGTNGLNINCGNQNVRGSFTGGIGTGIQCSGLSDERVKKNIVALDDNIIQRIKDVGTFNFDFDCSLAYFDDTHCNDSHQTGVIAQQLAEVFPELVYEGEDGYLRVDYEALNIYTLKAVTQISKAFHNQHRPVFSNSSALQDYTFAQAALPADEWLQQLNAVNTGVQAEIISDRVSAVSELIAPEVITKQLRTSIITTGPNGLQINLSSNDGKFALVGADGEALFEVDADGNAYFAGDIQADNTDVLAAVDTKLQALLNTGIVAGGSSEFYGLLNIHALTNFFDEVVFADNVTFQSIVTFNNDNGGFATIKEGDREVRIEFEQPFPDAPVVNVSNTDGKFVSYSYGNLDETGFTIILEESALEDINFSWTAFAITSPRTEVSISNPEE